MAYDNDGVEDSLRIVEQPYSTINLDAVGYVLCWTYAGNETSEPLRHCRSSPIISERR